MLDALLEREVNDAIKYKTDYGCVFIRLYSIKSKNSMTKVDNTHYMRFFMGVHWDNMQNMAKLNVDMCDVFVHLYKINFIIFGYGRILLV